jgi:arginyl-tRNA synthetase
MDIKNYLSETLHAAVQRHFPEAGVSAGDIVIEEPRQKQYGDLSSPVAMLLAKKLKQRPDTIARTLMQDFAWDSSMVEPDPALAHTIIGGFLNFTVSKAYLHDVLQQLVARPECFGAGQVAHPSHMLIEFVSANPTGPMVVVNARAAAIGDAISRINSHIGNRVTREYYVNDYGSQIKLLGQSIAHAYFTKKGHTYPRPENGYAGDYIQHLAEQIAHAHPEMEEMNTREVERLCAREGLAANLAGQKETLQRYRVEFDNWFHEQTLHRDGYPEKILSILKSKALVYRADNAVWFRAIEFGDEKDRVLVRSDGSPTYFLADLAYHHYKASRGFDTCITFWGPDHHGYLPRLEAAVKTVVATSTTFYNYIIQQVSLIRDGKPFRMSKRKGTFITIEDLVEEVGVDAARYFFLRRKLNAHFEFDIDLALKRSEENPVYYVQYAHARTCNVLQHAYAHGYQDRTIEHADPGLLVQDEEKQLLKHMAMFPDTLLKSAHHVEPHRLASYIEELAALYHQFYQKHRIVTEDTATSAARLLLTLGVRNCLRNALSLLGVTAPEHM